MGGIYHLCRLLGYIHLLGVHLVLGEILHIYCTKMAKTHMQGKEGLLYPLNLHSFKELPAEMQPCSRSCNRAVVLCKDCMEPLQIYRLRSLSNPLWNRNAAYTKESLSKFIVRAVIEKTQCSAAGCGIINNLCHK